MVEKKKDRGVSPAEDMRGRPTTVRGEPDEGLPRREAETEPQGVNPRGRTEEERDESEALNAIPDGDGPRSDRGTNPLPDSYWSAYPDKDKR